MTLPLRRNANEGLELPDAKNTKPTDLLTILLEFTFGLFITGTITNSHNHFSALPAATGVPFTLDPAAVMYRFSQSFVDSVMNVAHVGHQLYFFGARERLQLSLHLQEMRGAQFTGVEVSEEQDEGVPLLPQFRSDLFRECSRHHVQNGPAHPP
jgi:hypothetical protein